MGMPVQVFPTGPPAPPPPPPKVQLATQPNNNTNGNHPADPKRPAGSIKSNEPPPFGFRPEIKIPPNPMARLKPTPKPQQRDDFWVEEYRKERSKSPAVIPQSEGLHSTAPLIDPHPLLPPSPPAIPFHLPETSTASKLTPSPNLSLFVSSQSPPNPLFRQSDCNLLISFTDIQDTNTNYSSPDSYESSSSDRQIGSPHSNAASESHRIASPLVTTGDSLRTLSPAAALSAAGSPSLDQTRVESPFSTQPNPYLPRPLSPVKLTPERAAAAQYNNTASSLEDTHQQQQEQLLLQQQLQQRQQQMQQQQQIRQQQLQREQQLREQKEQQLREQQQQQRDSRAQQLQADQQQLREQQKVREQQLLREQQLAREQLHREQQQQQLREMQAEREQQQQREQLQKQQQQVLQQQLEQRQRQMHQQQQQQQQNTATPITNVSYVKYTKYS